MKRFCAFVLIAASLIALHSLSAFAADDDVLPVDNFAVTGGINTEKACDITFDSTRLISGTAAKDTVVTISVYDITDPDNKVLDSCYDLTVGSAGIFSQSIDLAEGKNYVIVAASNGNKHSEVSTVINRKGRFIKAVLSQYIALPGQSK
ncbi:MAG: hypothetical protein IJL89_06795 [Firmicutes bacterium]|nr:hypothetical protein [Bacillota bacterium]